MNRRVAVGLSGGVDSAVAAALLVSAGYDVTGVFLECWKEPGCRTDEDRKDALSVALKLGIPFQVLDLRREYNRRVVEYFYDEYRAGRTPNPGVMCKKEIKFGLFFEKVLKLGADFVATGHYVRRHEIKNQKSKIKTYVLATARDLNKDQSYFLWTLTQAQLAHCLFPIGEYTKPQVRVLAKKFGLLTATKKDSQGICFLGQVSIRDFLKQYIKPKKGDILLAPSVIPAEAGIQNRRTVAELDSGSEAGMTSQRVVGTHEGAYLYTIGQRHGFGVGGLATPHYVVAKDVEENTITIAPENHLSLYKTGITLTSVNFISPKLEIRNWKLGIPVRARVR